VAGLGVLKLKVQAAASGSSSEDSSLASVTGISKIVKCLLNFNLYANYYVDLNCMQIVLCKNVMLFIKSKFLVFFFQNSALL
jgi:hypothetical protein